MFNQDYKDFLKTKKNKEDTFKPIEASDIHPALFPFQKDVVEMLLKITYPHIRNEYQWGKIIGGILELQPWETTTDPVSLHDLFNRTLGALLLVLSEVKVLDDGGNRILELGEPDPTLLPPAREDKASSG